MQGKIAFTISLTQPILDSVVCKALGSNLGSSFIDHCNTFKMCQKVGRAGGGGQMVSTFAFYCHDPSMIPVHLFFCKFVWNNEKEARNGPAKVYFAKRVDAFQQPMFEV